MRDFGGLALRFAMLCIAQMLATPSFATEFSIVDVNVNGISKKPVVIAWAAAGELLAQRSDVSSWGLETRDAATTVLNGKDYVILNSVPGVQARVADGSMQVSAERSAFPLTQIDLGKNTDLSAQSGDGAYLNYSLTSVSTNGKRPASGATTEAVAFSGSWSLSSSAAAADAAQGRRFVRYDTTVRRDFPQQASALSIGDAVSRSGALARSFRFGGLSYGTDFGTRPDIPTFALPVLSGEARVPTAADLLINGQPRGRFDLPAGPFEIANLPAVNGAGEIQLLTRDALGQQRVLVLPFYVAPSLLKPGLTDGGVEVGKVREDYGLRSGQYGRGFVRASARRGVSSELTVEGFAESVGNGGVAGAGLSTLLPGNLLANSAVALSGPDAAAADAFVAVEHIADKLSFGLRGEWAGENFSQIGATPMLKKRLSANAGLFLGEFGSVAAVTARQSTYDGKQSVTTGITYQKQLARQLALLANISVTRIDGVLSRFGSIVLSIPLDTNSNATLSASQQGGKNDYIADFRQNLPASEGWASRARLAHGQGDRADVGATAQTAQGVWSADLGHAANGNTIRVGASGAIVAAGGVVRTVRQLGDAFAIVAVPGYPGVDVFHENLRIATTDADGIAVIPRLRAYQVNNIAVDTMRLTLSTQLGSASRTIVPVRRNGVLVKFKAETKQGALLRVIQPDGRPVPAGATLLSRGNAYPVAANGDIYLSNARADDKAIIRWQDGRCALRIPEVGNDKVLPRIGPLTCAEASS